MFLHPSPSIVLGCGAHVTLPEAVLEQIDRYTEAHGFTRSGFLTQAAKRAMKEELEAA
jgi:metal-responsive CopG/Arc/MetJ family transcriptional regulator